MRTRDDGVSVAGVGLSQVLALDRSLITDDIYTLARTAMLPENYSFEKRIIFAVAVSKLLVP